MSLAPEQFNNRKKVYQKCSNNRELIEYSWKEKDWGGGSLTLNRSDAFANDSTDAPSDASAVV